MYSMQLITIQIVSKNRIIHARTDNLYESEQRKQQQQQQKNTIFKCTEVQMHLRSKKYKKKT